MVHLAQLGYHSANEKAAAPKTTRTTTEDESETDAEEDRIAKLEARVARYEQQEIIKSSHQTLDGLLAGNETAKENPELVEVIKIAALAVQNTKPDFSLQDATNFVLKKFDKAIGSVKDKVNKQLLVHNNISGRVLRTSGGVATIDKSKKYTAKDVRSGESEKALRALLEQAGLPE